MGRNSKVTRCVWRHNLAYLPRNHTEYIMQICNQQFNLLSQMKNKQDLPQKKQLNIIFKAVIVSGIFYEESTWRSYAHIADI